MSEVFGKCPYCNEDIDLETVIYKHWEMLKGFACPHCKKIISIQYGR